MFSLFCSGLEVIAKALDKIWNNCWRSLLSFPLVGDLNELVPYDRPGIYAHKY